MTSDSKPMKRPGLVNILYLVFSIMVINSGVQAYQIVKSGFGAHDASEFLANITPFVFFIAAIVALFAITTKKEWSKNFCIVVACLKAILFFAAAYMLFSKSPEIKALVIGYCVRGSLLFYLSYNLHINQELREYLGFETNNNPKALDAS